jgi:predicted ATPase
MRIETIRVRNFKALQNVELKNLPAFCVFVGRNGSGKTTLFRVFAFLKHCLEHNVRSALNAEGGRNGFKEVVTRGHETESIDIEIQFRMEITGYNRLVTYSLEIAQDKKGLPFVRREILRYERGSAEKPFHLLDFQNGEGYTISNQEDFSKPDEELERESHKLNSADTLAIKGLGQFEQYLVPHAISKLLESFHLFDFYIGDARGVKDDEDALHLSASGSNLPAFARYMFEQHPEEFELVKQKMRDRVPGIQDIEVKVTEDGRLLVRYQDGAFSEPFIDKNVSDGTVKMFSYLLLLHDPKPHPVLCIEEPENQLYPELMTLLAEEFLQYARRGGQVFVSTHSPQFLNAVPLESLYHIDKAEGVSRIVAIADDPLISQQIKDGDLAGYLWEQGLFKGVTQRIEKR